MIMMKNKLRTETTKTNFVSIQFDLFKDKGEAKKVNKEIEKNLF